MPLCQALFKHSPEDFQVDELMDVNLEGTGEFLWLQVLKKETNTQDVAKLLADKAGLPPGAVSHSGLKDRQSVASQWFSLHLPGKPDPELPTLLSQQVTIIQSRRHLRKLRIGTHRGNGFQIRLRDLQGDRESVLQRCQQIAEFGVPNYFGEQRFGRGGDNLRQVLNMYGESRRRRRSRHLEGLLHSSARAFLFNQVLARRVLDGSWHDGADGDIWMLSGSRSIFGPEPLTEALRQRVIEGDVAPTGPLYGRSGESGGPALEAEVLALYPELTQGLDGANARPARRRLSLRPGAFTFDADGADLLLKFELSRGEFATGLIRELVSPFQSFFSST